MMCSYVFWPLAVIMGVEIDDAFNVARLIGVKIFADEFISFQDLAIMVCDRSIQVRSNSPVYDVPGMDYCYTR